LSSLFSCCATAFAHSFSLVINVFQTTDSSRYLRSQVLEAGKGPSLLNHYKLIQSVQKHLADNLTLIENDLNQRFCVAETSLENATEISSWETDLTKLEEFASFKEEKRKSNTYN